VTENTVPTTAVGTGFMERIGVFPFEFEVTDTEDCYSSYVNGGKSILDSILDYTKPSRRWNCF